MTCPMCDLGVPRVGAVHVYEDYVERPCLDAEPEE